MDSEDTGAVSQGAFLAYIASSKRASLKVLASGPTGSDADATSDDGADPRGRRRNVVSRAAAPPE